MSHFKRPRQRRHGVPLLPLLCEMCVPEGRGALLELAVVNHVESSSSWGCWAGTNEAVKMTGPRGIQGISWCSVGSLPGMRWEGRSLGRKADSWNIWWLHLERKKKQGWSCCLVPKSCAGEGPCDSRENIGSPVSWHLVIWKKPFIRNQIIGFQFMTLCKFPGRGGREHSSRHSLTYSLC